MKTQKWLQNTTVYLWSKLRIGHETMQIAEEILKAGYTVQSFLEDATGVVTWKKEKNQQPPYSLQYFMSRKVSQQKAKHGKDAMDIVKQLSNRMKLR